MPYSDDELRRRIEVQEGWKADLADILDMLGSREDRLSNRPLTFKNLDELVFQLRKTKMKD